MPRKKTKCSVEGCIKETNGDMCESHSREKRIKRQGTLKEYKAAWNRQKKYGITEEEFGIYWVAQKGKCAICEQALRLPLASKGQPLDVVAVDHDHSTGLVRGLLCNACNKGLGLFKDNPINLQKAKEYLNG